MPKAEVVRPAELEGYLQLGLDRDDTLVVTDTAVKGMTANGARAIAALVQTYGCRLWRDEYLLCWRIVKETGDGHGR